MRVANSPMEQALQILLQAGETKMSSKSKRVHAEGPRVGALVDHAVQAMAEEAKTDKLLTPGLHVRRYRIAPDGKVFYSVVRVIGVDRGQGMVCKVYTVAEENGGKLTRYEIETSDFQRITE